jgi:hypothetical protein
LDCPLLVLSNNAMGDAFAFGRIGAHRSSREAVANWLLLAILLVGIPLLLASEPKILNDGDVSWHIAAGRWILANGRLPNADPFSFTAAGQPWVTTEWLAEIVFASAFQLDSYAGLSAVVAGSLLALNWIVFAEVRRTLGPIGITATLIAVDVVLSPFIVARPHVLVWPLLASWTVLLLRSTKTGRPPPLWSTLLLVAWTNTHPSFPLALPIAVTFAYDALARANWKAWRQWALFLATSVGALMLNANGVPGLIEPFKITALKMLPLIEEWHASNPSLTPVFYGVLLIGLGALLHKGVRVPPGQLLLLLFMLAMAFSQVRHQSWFIIVAALAIAPVVEGSPVPLPSARPFAVGAVLSLVVRLLVPMNPVENPSNPWYLLDAVPRNVRAEPVFNGYDFGGPLIRSGIRPYIDGRAEIYGDEFVSNYKSIADGSWTNFNSAVRRYDIAWTILSAKEQPLIRKLDSSPQWRRVASTRAGVIHVRRRQQ